MNELVIVKDNQIIVSEETINKIKEFQKMNKDRSRLWFLVF